MTFFEAIIAKQKPVRIHWDGESEGFYGYVKEVVAPGIVVVPKMSLDVESDEYVDDKRPEFFIPWSRIVSVETSEEWQDLESYKRSSNEDGRKYLKQR